METYFINLEDFGMCEVQATDVFFALECCQKFLEITNREFKILNVLIKINENENLDITDLILQS
jgi:hypothetical protein